MANFVTGTPPAPQSRDMFHAVRFSTITFVVLSMHMRRLRSQIHSDESWMDRHLAERNG
jgi:hypothetical protein